MVNILAEGSLNFEFPDHIDATKYDEWSFYRNQMNSAFGGSKAIDLIGIEKKSTMWLIEIKDYRRNQRTKPIDIADEIAAKARDTLVGLIAALLNANSTDEQSFAKRALKTKKIRIVLHLEQPLKHSRLFPIAINPINVQQKMKQQLKTIDAHPVVVDHQSLRPDMGWRVFE